jgi:carboxyl-terminal processing protease
MKGAVALLMLCLVGCYQNETPTPAGIKYLDEILDTMEKYSVYKKSIDWTKFRADAMTKAQNVQSVEDLYPILPSIISQLGDHQTTMQTKDGVYISGDLTFCPNIDITEPTNLDNIGYIRIISLGDRDLAAFNQYAVSIQRSIQQQDKADLAGWIVDLRSVSGVNFGAMIAGVGPLIGTGNVVYFTDPDNHSKLLSYTGDGTAHQDDEVLAWAESPYTIINNSHPKIALLLNDATGFSGEVTAMAFSGMPNVKTFGTKTCDPSTVSYPFRLSDGSILFMSAARIADRVPRILEGAIVPDVIVDGDLEVVAKAVEWINTN